MLGPSLRMRKKIEYPPPPGSTDEKSVILSERELCACVIVCVACCMCVCMDM